MSKPGLIASLSALATVILYLLLSFVQWDFYPGNWPNYMRTGACVCWLLFTSGVAQKVSENE